MRLVSYVKRTFVWCVFLPAAARLPRKDRSSESQQTSVEIMLLSCESRCVCLWRKRWLHVGIYMACMQRMRAKQESIRAVLLRLVSRQLSVS